jgi:hypothetical protein
VCVGRPELPRQVEDLLRLHEGAGSFLDEAAARSAATGAVQDAEEMQARREAAKKVVPSKAK